MIGAEIGAPRVPAYALTLDGQDLTSRIAPRLQSLTLTDRRGLEADQLDLVLEDHDGLLALPRAGVQITLALGWQGALIDRGSYTVDEVEHSGAPDLLTIRARSADLCAGTKGAQRSLTRKRDQSWHRTTLGDILRTIAARQSLEVAIAPALAGTAIQHEDQTKESDLAFITRLSGDYGAIATIKSGRLIFTPPGEGTTVSGAPLPTILIPTTARDTHRFHLSDRDAYTGVVAEWQDTDQGKKQEVVAGDPDNAKRLRPTYASEASALAVARAELARLQRGLARLDLTLAEGRADLSVESPCSVSGIKREIDAYRWICIEAMHRLDNSGYLTNLQCEAPAAA